MERRENEIKNKWDFIMKDPILSISSIKKKAFDGLLAEKGLRSLCWKIFLDYLPNLETSTWQIEINKERQHYEDLKNKFIFDPNKTNNEEVNWNVNNPLSLEEESPWKQYFDNTELQKTIKQDVERTFPDIEFFRNVNVQNMLCNILFIYCKLNKDISYRQGMHEILAPILLVVDTDKIDTTSTVIEDELIKNILDSKYVEHDSFFLFCQVMKSAKTWYEFNETVSSTFNSNKEKFIVPIVAKCQKIQNEMLKVIDNDLYMSLKKHEIEPQLYGLRWLRLLFSREFPMDDVLILWDGIFAEGNNLDLVDYIALVMLIHIRDEIIGQEFSVCLTKLMKYPKLKEEKEIVLFIENARKLKENWVELLSKNNELYKENINQQNNQSNQNKMNKIQSIIKSATGDKRISWNGYDSHKSNKNSYKSVSYTNAVSSSNINNEEYKSSLHEKHLEEENKELKSKIGNLEELIKNANEQMIKCMELINDIDSKNENSETVKNIDITLKNEKFKKLIVTMKKLENILNNDKRNHFYQSSNIKQNVSSSSPVKNILPAVPLIKDHMENINNNTSNSSTINNVHNNNAYNNKTNNDDNNLSQSVNQEKIDDVSNINYNFHDRKDINQTVNTDNNKSKVDIMINDNYDKKIDEKIEIKDSNNLFSSTLTPSISLNNKLNESSLDNNTSVVETTVTSTMALPNKISRHKSSDFSSLDYNKDNIWSESPKLLNNDTNNFQLKNDGNNHFDDIQLQDSNIVFNTFNTIINNDDASSTGVSSNKFNTLSIGNPWEDPWNKSNEEPKDKTFQFNITTNDLFTSSANDDQYNNKNSKNKLSPSSIHFNPFESPVKTVDNTPSSINNNSNITNNINSIITTTSSANATININANTTTTTTNNNNNYNNSFIISPHTSPKLNNSVTSPKSKSENISIQNSGSNKKDNNNTKKPSYSSSFNTGNSLYSFDALSPSFKNQDIEKRIEENKKILFSYDDKNNNNNIYNEETNRHSFYNHNNNSYSKLNNNSNSNHGLFNDEKDTDDIFEFIKQSKNRNSVHYNNNMVTTRYSSYSKSYNNASNENSSSNNSPSLKSPKINHFSSNSVKSPKFSNTKVNKPIISNQTECVEYDPLLSPQLKSKQPYNYNDLSGSTSANAYTDVNFKSPSLDPLSPALSTSAIVSTANGVKSSENSGVPIVIEHLQSTSVDSLDTNKNAKPVLLDPLGAGVVHSIEF